VHIGHGVIIDVIPKQEVIQIGQLIILKIINVLAEVCFYTLGFPQPTALISFIFDKKLL
tara:strand:- start:1586 stop:1762 length:177 start_codon:yes stop_codon:yes gene_type:complete